MGEPVRNIVIGQPVSPEKVELVKRLRREMTPAKRLFWEQIRSNRLRGLRRQQVIDGFVADFYCHAAALVIEIDGPVHEGRTGCDADRDAIFQQRGLTVLGFTNDE